MTAATAVLVGLFAGYRFGFGPKALRITLFAIAVVLVFQTIVLATVDKGRAFEGNGAWLYWLIQVAIFAAGAVLTWVGAKIRRRAN